MLKNRILILLVVVMLLVPFMSVVAQDKNLVEVATEAGNFTTLLAAAQAAGLADALAAPDANLTVFAPTDEAFAALEAAVPGVTEFLLANPDALAMVLTYHAVSGVVMSADVATGEVATLQGGTLDIVVDDMGVHVDQANVIAADVTASNGVIHVIDSVLLPDITLPEVDPLTVEGDIVTAGSSTVFPLSEAVAARFSAEGYTGTVTVDSIGTGAGFERFCVNGETDISNASRAIRQEEADSCAALTPARTPLQFRVGTDGLAVVVSGENDFVTDVTLEELAAIFGTAVNWSDVRPEWPNQPILRFIPGTDSGTFDYFVEEVFDEDEAPILAATNTQLSEDDNVLVQGVESSPFAIGFFGYAYFAEEGDRLRALAIDGVTPNLESVEGGTYALARPLFIYSDAGIIAEKPQVGAFINFYLGIANEEALAVGYFPASDYAINVAKVRLLIAMAAGM